MEKTGKSLKLLRKKLGKNQTELGEILGMHYNAIGNYERGEREIPEWVWERLAELNLIPTDPTNHVQQKRQSDIIVEQGTDYYRGQADMAYRMYKDMLDRVGKVLERTEVALSSKQQGYRTGLRNPVGGHERKGEKEQTRTEPKTVQ